MVGCGRIHPACVLVFGWHPLSARCSLWRAFFAGPGRAEGICYWGGCWLCSQGCSSYWTLCHQGWGKYLRLQVFHAFLTPEPISGFFVSFSSHVRLLCSYVRDWVMWIHHTCGYGPSKAAGLWALGDCITRGVCFSHSACKQSKAAK